MLSVGRRWRGGGGAKGHRRGGGRAVQGVGKRLGKGVGKGVGGDWRQRKVFYGQLAVQLDIDPGARQTNDSSTSKYPASS